MKNHAFDSNGKCYEIKYAIFDENIILIRAFETQTGNFANGIQYQVTLDAGIYIQDAIDNHMFETTVEAAKADVISNKWNEIKSICRPAISNLSKWSKPLVWI